MFECKHCLKCVYAEKSETTNDFCKRWCTLKHSEHSIADACSNFIDRVKYRQAEYSHD